MQEGGGKILIHKRFKIIFLAFVAIFVSLNFLLTENTYADANKRLSVSDFQGDKSSAKVQFSGNLDIEVGKSCSGLINVNYNGATIGGINCGGEIITSYSNYSSVPYAEIYVYNEASIDSLKSKITKNLSSIISNYHDGDNYIFAQDNINNIAIAIEDLQGSGTNEGGEGENSENSDERFKCNDSDLAGQNWLLCSTGENLADTIGVFFRIVDNMLTVDTKLYSMKKDNGDETAVYKFWEFCRNTANVIMVIILLVIIFSQLTGVGIDNYGIKKMLPKLIIMSILINISFFLCQIAVDLSNIVGSNIDGLLKQVSGVTDIQEVIMGVLTGLLGAVAAAGAAAGTAATIATLVMGLGFGLKGIKMAIVIGIILAVIILAGLAIVAVMMAVRMMIILIAIGTAPLALACYILPNTKGIYKKWFDAFKAALLVYPVVGTLHGLSYIIKAITFKDGDFFMMIVGSVSTVIPYYVIPSLLKKAINATGMIGSAISGIGQSVKNGYRQGVNAAKNTDAYKQIQDRGRARLNENAIKRLEKKEKNGKLNDFQKRRLGQRRLAAEQYGQSVGQLERYGGNDFTGEELAEAARQNAYTDAGSKANQTLGKSDAIKVYESNFGKNSAETSRLASAKGNSDQLKNVISNNRATETFRTENAAREVDLGNAMGAMSTKEKQRVVTAAKNGSLANITTANGYTKAESAMAQQLINRHGQNGLTGAASSAILSDINSIAQSNASSIDEVIAAASNGTLANITTANGNSGEQVALAQQLIAQTGNSLSGKTTADVLKAINSNGSLSVAAAQVVGGRAAIEGVLSGNAAINQIGLSDAQIQQSVNTGTDRGLNKLEMDFATDMAGEVRISHQRAADLASQRLTATRSKEFSEEFTLQPRGDIKRILNEEVNKATGGDATRVGAALKDIIAKGGFEDVMSVIYSANIQDSNIQKTIDEYMATMTDPVAKQYGKYKAAGGKGTFKQFVDGTAPILPSGGISSFHGYLETLDENGFNNATKDTIKFLNSTGNYEIVSSAQAANLAYAAKGEDRAAALKMVSGKIGSDSSERLKIAESYSDNQWSNMSLDLIQIVTGATGDYTTSSDPGVDKILNDVRARIQSDTRLKNNLKPEVRAFFKI